VKAENLSDARDTQVLQKALAEKADEINIGDAGTAMRFLTAYCAFQQQDVVLTGSARMQERPIGPLVEALRSMGADIACMGREGYPPLMIFGRNARFGDSTIGIAGNISSQYISALLLIAPTLTDGLDISVTGKISSRPYIDMTLSLLEECGIHCEQAFQRYHIARQSFRPATLVIDPDWSAASYWYSIAGLAAPGTQIFLNGLGGVPRQGDSRIAGIMEKMGVTTTPEAGGILLTQSKPPSALVPQMDFTHCPDLAQTVIVYCAAQHIEAVFTGLESLRIKETDRIAALTQELSRFGITLEESKAGWSLKGIFKPRRVSIETYGDHRMAMAFAPLAIATGELEIRDADVVEKSYPAFWSDLADAGFGVERR
jgi:3-phosphoshikimate 1-carboxyvinyltransferase